MLKRNDLSKQFENVVKQEIKNYNDSLSLVFQNLNELRESIHDVHEEALENYAILHSVQTNIGIKLENIEEKLSEFCKKVDRQFNDQQVINERNAYQINEMADALHSKIRGQDHFEKKIDQIEKKIDQENEKFLQFHLASAKAMDELTISTRKTFQKHLQELDKRPLFKDPNIEDLEMKLFAYKVDGEALLKELRVTRNDLMVAEKKIENIYTLIERLKKSGVNT